MHAYTAELTDGTVMILAAEPGLDRDEFADHVAKYLNSGELGDDAPQDVTLYQWRNLTWLAAWIDGTLPAEGQTWTTMRRHAEYGSVTLGYAGRGEGTYEFRPVGSGKEAK